MAFINEYISDEDVEKYKVKEAWREISPGFGGQDDFPSEFAWTVDKEKNIYFISMRSGKEEISNWKVCALWWDGTLLTVTLAVIDGWLDYEGSKGEKVWGLININKPDGFQVAENEIANVLKDALIIYRYAGIKIPVNDYKVSFTF